MTVSSQINRKDYPGNGSSVNFPTEFRFLEDSHLKVILTVEATATETEQVLITDYTVTGKGDDSGGTVTMIIPPKTGENLTIIRNVPITQQTDYVENDDFPAESHERALDKLTMVVQQQQEELTRTLKLSEGQESTGLTIPAPNEGKFLQWDAFGNFINVDLLNQGLVVLTPFGQTLINSVDADAARVVMESMKKIAAAVTDNVMTFDANDEAKDSGVPIRNLSQISLDSPRSIVQYGSLNTVKVRDTIYPMCGFRFHGRYRKNNVPTFSSITDENIISTVSDLPFGMTSDVKNNWYAVFACANDGDANVTFRAVPFLRFKTDLGSGEFELGVAGEGTTAAQIADPSLIPTQTYTWTGNDLAGSDCLVITETVDGRINAFSGREISITSSTTTTVTLNDEGDIGPLDWILPAPNVEFSNYRYCCSFYMDTHEIRNIADSGSHVGSRGIFDQTGTNTGSVASPEERKPSGNISPLATAVVLNSSASLSTATTGQYVENYATDGSAHDVANPLYTKNAAVSESFYFSNFTVPFSFGPQYWYSNAGAISSSRINGQQNLYGWIEP